LEILIGIAPALTILAVGLGLVGYALALGLAAFGPADQGSLSGRLRAWFRSAPAQNLGLPCAAISAFAIVAILLRAFSPSPYENGVLSFKAFGLEFSGPSGPITLWVICFRAFAVALKLLRV
jgi:hypothetical protein